NNRDYYAFETFAISLLKLHIESQEKPFKIISNDILGDAIASEGFDDFNGSTIIEIKPLLNSSNVFNLTNQFHKYFYKIAKDINVKNILIISSRKGPIS